tara:strand:+ start:178 stop:516 length:339 start_codon:yes stop_codon:yes gene_type:complete
MTRRIKVNEIKQFYEELIVDAVAGTTLEWTRRVKKATPVDTGRLRAAWQTDIKPLQGTIINNVVYAEPVCFGVNLPPSWGGRYRTRQQTVAGFPELIGKELEIYINQLFRKF